MVTRFLNREFFALGFVLLFFSFCLFLTRSSVFVQDPSRLSTAVTLDLLITLPFIYFLLIRNSKIPTYTCFTVFILGIITASYIIPSEHDNYLKLFKTYALPLIEISVIGLVFYKLFQIKRNLDNKKEPTDFYDTLVQACKECLPSKIDALVANEIGVFYYLFNIKSKEPKGSEFTYHKKSGTMMMASGLLFVILIETIVMHVLLHRWKPAVAWIATILSAYTCLQIFSFLRSLSKRYIEIDVTNGLLKLRSGYFNQSYINLSNIKNIERTQKTLSTEDGFLKLSPLDLLDSHNLIIYLNEEDVLNKMYGFKKTYRSIGIFVDEPDKFLESISQHIVLTDN